MKRWLLLTKNYRKLANDDELILRADEPVNKGDIVLVCKLDTKRHFSHIFQAKENSKLIDSKYEIILHKKKFIPNPVTLSELQKHNMLEDWEINFEKSINKIPLCTWGKIIGLIAEKNPQFLNEFEFKGCCGPDPNGFPKNLKKNLIELIKEIKAYKTDKWNEETAKYLIILPILQSLGWDIYDPKQIRPEYFVKYTNKKVDYRLKDHEGNKIFLEAKSPSQLLSDHKCQLIKYCIFQNIDLGIITNGIGWKFYYLDYHVDKMCAIKNLERERINIHKDNPEKIADKFIEIFWNNKTSKSGKLGEPAKLNDIIADIRKIKEKDKKYYNESAVKQSIVLPLLANLGWDIKKNSEFKFKSIGADFILGEGKNRIFIDVKSLNDDLEIYDILEKHERRLFEFGDSGNFDFGVLTNGDIWMFYLIETRDFYGFKISADGDEIINEFNNLLSKENVLSGLQINYLQKDKADILSRPIKFSI